MNALVGTTDVGRFLADHAVELRRRIHNYARRAGLLDHGAAEDLVEDVFQDLMLIAIERERTFDPSRPCLAWAQGIITNLLKQRLALLRRRSAFAPAASCDMEKDGALFDRMAEKTYGSPDSGIAAEQLLSLVSEDDRHVLSLSILCGMNGDDLARELHVKPGAARVRVSRALSRLRKALESENTEPRKVMT